LADQSDPAQSRFVWAYTIHIRNDGPVTVQLLNRHWHITDAAGRARDVRGPGVIGEQPILAPGEEFEYTSGVPLTTASGIMEGEYEMVLESGAKFEVLIPAFSLDSPVGSSRPN
jgi:ApaG protein